MYSKATLGLLALVMAAFQQIAATPVSCAPNAGATVCVDSVNKCGQKYGGCGPVNCDGSFPSFSKPPCPSTTTTKTVPTTTKCAPNAGATVCVDYVNECGRKYGGCGPRNCDGSFPKFSKPPCTSTTTTTKPTPTTSKPCAPNAGAIICVDYVNECGRKYGGCVPVQCDGTLPKFEKPPCPTTTTTKTTKTPTFTTIRTTGTTKPPASTTSCAPDAGVTVCIDNIDACGRMYGGCGPVNCDGSFPTYTAPPGCDATSTSTTTIKPTRTKTTATSKPTPGSCDENAGRIVCIDAINECGQKYGGCGPVNCDGSFPKFDKPPCPADFVEKDETSAEKTKRATDIPVCAPNAGLTVCVTHVNACGAKSSVCGPVSCDGSFPKPEFPSCPGAEI